MVEDLRGREIEDVADLLRRIQCLERLGHSVNIYPDAEEFIQRRLLLERISRRATETRVEPESHPLRRELLKTELLPYQLDGIAFALSAGRAVIADEMGLGKTIRAIGVSELRAREAGVSKVLVICPASLTSQWRNENPAQSLTDLVAQDAHGRPLLTLALPDRAALDNVSNILARLLAGIQSAQVTVMP